MTDRTGKLLLTLIVLGLWGHLLHIVFAPAPSLAAQQLDPIPESRARFTAPIVNIHPTNRDLYVTDNAGYMYRVDMNTLEIVRTVRLVPKP